MPDVMDFPLNPAVGQRYTAPSGNVYTWNGFAWTVGFYDNATQTINTVGGLLAQVRTLLQDVDTSAGEYRYSSDSIITNLNQCMLDMFRLRPDLFLETGYVVPTFSVMRPDDELGIEAQYIPALIYYVVGLTQARDDEQNQDARATGFMKVFQSAITSGGLSPQ